MSETCIRHPSHPIAYRCAACTEALCFDCVRDTGRLILCGFCGELAIAVEAETSTEVGGESAGSHRELGRQSGQGWVLAALKYPLRGRQRILLVCLTAVVVAVLWGLSSTLTASCLFLGPFFLTMAAVVLTLGDIVRSSASGESDLGGWVDFGDPGSRLVELAAASITACLCLVPTGLLFQLFGCAQSVQATGRVGPFCFLVVVVGLAAGIWCWMVVYGVVATLDRFWISLRVDQHGRSFALQPRRDLESAVLVTSILLAGMLGGWLIDPLPLVGERLSLVVEVTLSLYAAMIAAHLAGLRVRDLDDKLAAIYND